MCVRLKHCTVLPISKTCQRCESGVCGFIQSHLTHVGGVKQVAQYTIVMYVSKEVQNGLTHLCS